MLHVMLFCLASQMWRKISEIVRELPRRFWKVRRLEWIYKLVLMLYVSCNVWYSIFFKRTPHQSSLNAVINDKETNGKRQIRETESVYVNTVSKIYVKRYIWDIEYIKLNEPYSFVYIKYNTILTNWLSTKS